MGRALCCACTCWKVEDGSVRGWCSAVCTREVVRVCEGCHCVHSSRCTHNKVKAGGAGLV